MANKLTYEELEQRVEDLEKKDAESKRVEEALRESEEKFRSLVDRANDGIVLIQEGIIKYVNPCLAEIVGYPVEQLIGTLFIEHIHHDEISLLIDRYEQRMSGEEVLPIYETIIKLKDGTDVHVEINASVITYQGAPADFAIIRDITERKQAEQALLKSEEKYRTILESIEDGYYEIDIAGTFTFLNDSFCKIGGYSKDEVLGMNYRKFMDKENAQKVYKVFNQVYAIGTPTKRSNYEILNKDGSKRYVEVSISLIRNKEGQPIGFQGIMRDVTDRKHAEEEKKKLEAQLQTAQRMESIGTIAGGIAHNFNNLLMGIQGNASLVLLDVDSDHPHHKHLNNVKDLVKNGAKLTSQLLGYAREGKYEVKPISLNQLVKETAHTFRVNRKEIIVHQELAEKLYGIEVDHEQIEQVLLTMYVNAADAMPGGGDLFLKTMNVTDKDMTGKPYEPKPGNYILLTVRDTGVGMDKNTMDRIFDPFFTTKGLARGTGLGLASAYGIVKGHGGYIDVHSENGKGTTFEIYLPATEKEVEEEKVLSGELVEGKETVLLVDDKEPILEVGEQILKKMGYEVLLACNGQEALELYEKDHNKIDMVLLDMVMPGMGGGKTYDKMKEINPEVKVLLLSGYSIDGEATEILERGCDGFIQKPFDLVQLSRSVRDILDENRRY
jgi:PAS domain S-box-containing protein